MLVVVNLEEMHPAFSLPEEIFAALCTEFPQIEFHWNRHRRDFYQRVADADVLWSWQLSPEIFKLARNLKWFHAQAVGVRRSIFPELKKANVIITNARNVPSRAVAEHCLALILALIRRIPNLVKSQEQRLWASDAYQDHFKEIGEVSSYVFAVFGLGSIGQEIARLLKAFGATVFGYRLRAIKCDFVDRIYHGEGMDEILGQSEFVIDTLPATELTRKFFNQDKFSRMRQGAFFVNVGRGWTHDEDALIRALGYEPGTGKWEQGWLGGAALDVFHEEPLPKDSPLWTAPNVIISPHVASVSRNYWDRAKAVFSENLRRFVAGGQLLNLVDIELGY